MKSKAVMLLGTGSDVGKSTITAGLCRLFANQGGACKIRAQSIFERFCQDLLFDLNSHTPKSRVFRSNGKDW